MAIDLNLGGVTSAGTPLPESEYIFQIEDYEEAPAKSGESTNVKLKLTVIEPVDYNGRPHRETINVQQSTMPFVKAFVKALTGLEEDELDAFTLSEETTVGQRIGGKVTHKQDGDNTYANVTAWFTA